MYHEHIEKNKFKLSAKQLIRTIIQRYIYLAWIKRRSIKYYSIAIKKFLLRTLLTLLKS